MRKCSKEFKKEALKLSDEIGVKSAASQLGLQYYTLAEWRKNRKAETKLPDPATDAEQRARIRELERECSELPSETSADGTDWLKALSCTATAAVSIQVMCLKQNSSNMVLLKVSAEPDIALTTPGWKVFLQR